MRRFRREKKKYPVTKLIHYLSFEFGMNELHDSDFRAIPKREMILYNSHSEYKVVTSLQYTRQYIRPQNSLVASKMENKQIRQLTPALIR